MRGARARLVAGASRIVFTCETPGRTVAELMERFFDARSNGSRDIQAERVGPDSAEERNSDPDGRSDLFATAPSGRTLISLSLLDFSHRRIRITSSPVKHQTARCYDELGKLRALFKTPFDCEEEKSAGGVVRFAVGTIWAAVVGV